VTTSRRRFLAQMGRVAATVLLAPSSWAEASASNLRARLAADPLRPQFHLLPAANWMNDPCGPICAGGRYHMFFQYNPDGAYWGNMDWGHATSPDMVHWRHEPVALAPTPGGYDSAGVFSGCAVLDGGTPAVIYTGVAPPSSPAEATLRDGAHPWREVQCLAVSQDGLRTWHKAPAPVIARPPADLELTGFRDPCVWREGRDWMLALGSGIRGRGGAVLLYRSSDLRHWTYLHPLMEGKATGKPSSNPVDSGEMWECPDFFPLGGRHVLLISTAGKVFWHVGRYEQQHFTGERRGMVDLGAYYAARSMLDREDKRVLWGWIPERRPESEYRAAGWAGVMSLPRLLSLDADGDLRMEPMPGLQRLRGSHQRLRAGAKGVRALAALRIQDLSAEIDVDTLPLQFFRLRLISGEDRTFAEVEYQRERHGGELRLNGSHAPLSAPKDGNLNLRLFVDGSVLELFAGGTAVITDRVYVAPLLPLRVHWEGADALSRMDVWRIKPISRDRLTS
jgi:beta-fructofuranosidase